MKKVVKFGGSSLASAEQFKKVGNIIRKRNPEDMSFHLHLVNVRRMIQR